MTEQYRLILQPHVDIDAIRNLLVEEFGYDENEAEELARSGGVVEEGLDWRPLREMQSAFTDIEARTRIEPMESGEYQVRLISIRQSARDIVFEFLLELIGDADRADELIESSGIVMSDLSLEHARRVYEELVERSAKATIEPMEGENAEFIVEGHVYQESEAGWRALHDVRVRVLDQDVRDQQVLGESVTTGDGGYQVTYTLEAFTTGEAGTADLVFQVFNSTGIELVAHPERETIEYKNALVIPNATHYEEVDLIVEKDQPATPSEYELIKQAIDELDLGTLTDLTDEEIAFISTELMINKEKIEAFVQSHRLTDEAGMGDDLPAEVFYGLLRQGMPADLDELLEHEDDEISTALMTSIDANLLPQRLRSSIEEFIDRFEELRTRRTRRRNLFNGVLLADDTDSPLADYLVEIHEVATDIDLGERRTNAAGRFSFVDIDEGLEDRSKEFYFAISDPRGREFFQTTIDLDPVQPSFEIQVPLIERPSPGETNLSEVATNLDIVIPDSLKTYLEEESLKTLADIRTEGGLGSRSNLPVSSDDPIVRRLDAHAYLSLLPTTLNVNDLLVDEEFRTPLAIANSPQTKFVSTVTGDSSPVDGSNAKHIHTVAKAQARAAENLRTTLVTDRANSLSLDETDKEVWNSVKQSSAVAPTTCDCEECNSAVSPGAYLTDLLDHTLTFVERSNGQSLSLEDLSQLFLQPFDKLQASCDATERKVRQVRLCIEILRRYLGQHPPTNSTVLTQAEQDYRLTAYELLLNLIGTSREELTQATTDPGETTRLADRLGLPPTQLAGLVLSPGDVTEARLEQLFGLVDTTNEDVLRSIGTPQLVHWRLSYLESQWKTNDWIDDVYSRDERPIVDPDVVGPDDFRNPIEKPSPDEDDRPFDIWLRRRKWVDERIQEFVQAQEPDPDPSKLFDIMTAPFHYNGHPETIGPVWGSDAPAPTTFDDLRKDLETAATAESTRETIETKLSLTEESFLRLVEILAKHRTSRSDTREEAVTDEEWKEVHSILIQAQKREITSIWLDEEESANVEFGPKAFWHPLREPEVGEWSSQLVTQRPLVDPDILDKNELPDPPVGEDAIALWDERRKTLDKKYDALKTKRENDGFVALLNDAYPARDFLGSTDDWSQYLTKLDTDLSSYDPATVEQATTRAETDLAMTANEANHLISVYKRSEQESSDRLPTDAEWDRLYRRLTRSWKRKTEYPEWQSNETLDYWKALKARLPEWRASQEHRREWLQALDRRSQPPIIDPDIIDDADFTTPSQTDPATTIWQSRKKWLTDTHGEVDNISGTTEKERFDTMLTTVVGISLTQLKTLKDDHLGGRDISKRLGQITLNQRSFNYLVDVQRRLDRGETLTTARWNNVISILVEVRKCRMFWEWQQQERTEGVILAPKFFDLGADLDVRPNSDDPGRWRTNHDRRRQWEDTLETRVDQVRTVETNIQETVSSVEEELLPQLRDALLTAIDLPSEGIDAAEWVADRFLIDPKADGCQETTRVSQAIEVVQGVLFALRTGEDDFNDIITPQLVLIDEEFDERWEWLGSYEKWKAAMGVFLYPETVLHPTLRNQSEQTPAFRELVQTLRSSSRLTSKQGQATANRYANYFQDIASLDIEATCWATTRIASDDRGRTTEERKLFYMFARGRKTRTLYWSAYDPAKIEYDQTTWKPINLERKKKKDDTEEAQPVGNVHSIIGAVPFKGSIYLFMKLGEEGIPTDLEVITYDLDRSPWEVIDPDETVWSNLTQLKVNVSGSGLQAVVSQAGDESTPPKLIISDKDKGRVIKQLNWKGTDWYPYEWELQPDRGSTPVSTVITEQTAILFAIDYEFEGAGVFSLSGYAYSPYGYSQGVVFNEPIDSYDDFLGTVTWSGNKTTPKNKDKTYISVFWKSGDQPLQKRITVERGPGGNPTFTSSSSVSAPFLRINPSSGIHHIPTHNGLPEKAENTTGQVGQAIALTPSSEQASWVDDTHSPAVGDVHRQRLLLDPSATPIGTARSRVAPAIRDNVIPLYRSYHPETINHFYTTNLAEHKNATNRLGYRDEGTACYVHANQTSDTVPLYRSYNSEAVDHFYTTNLSEHQNAVGNLGYKDEGIACYVYSNPTSGTSPLRRLSHSEKANHFYTSDENEYQNAINNLKYKDEGIACYVYGNQASGTIKQLDPFYITANLSSENRQKRREYITSVFSANAGVSQSILAYIKEAYYFVPIQIALQLQESGQYTAALDWYRTVYDYDAEIGKRKIYYGLEEESTISSNYTLDQDWLLDPLNPHKIAVRRTNAYTRFTIMSIVRCLLDYADTEFTRDTAESVPRARTLYRTASKLLQSPELNATAGPCSKINIEFERRDDNSGYVVWFNFFGENDAIEARKLLLDSTDDTLDVGPVLYDLVTDINWIDDYELRSGTIERIDQTLREEEVSLDDRLGAARSIVTEAQIAADRAPVYETVITQQRAANPEWYSTILSTGNAADLLETAAVTQITQLGWENPEGPIWDVAFPDYLDPLHPLERPEIDIVGPWDPDQWVIPEVIQPTFTPKVIYSFCAPANPILKTLRTRVESNLTKIRNCMNIAGMQRQLEPYSAPTDIESSLPTVGQGGQLQIARRPTVLPTPYRYQTLISRARELANQAQQTEAAFLAALEKYDSETYNIIKARQDAEVTKAGVDLQKLRVVEAEDGILLAGLQEQRADTQVTGYQQWIDAGLNSYENEMITQYWIEANNQLFAALAGATAQTFQLGASALEPNAPQLMVARGILLGLSAASGFAQAHFTGASATARARAQVAGLYASHERRKAEWDLQKAVAEQDKAIAVQQRSAAEHHVDVVEQEQEIAELQVSHAEDIIEFLDTKFTNPELYEWMSDVLEGSYRYFLQQATAMAQLAENELAFERQEVLPTSIKTDYWETLSDDTVTTDRNRDRRGLTGSTRLIEDLTRLDQYAFQTDERKNQLTKTISLAQLFPAEFQRLREEGIMNFATSFQQFDRDFPGHFLRQIQRAQISVVGLIPPTEGVKATLTTSGISRVVTGGDVFRTSIVRRPPESISFTSPQNATGLFELQPLSESEMRNPFEGMGIATDWEFRLPHAANRFDYSSLMDVLITFEFTSLDSREYRQQVIQQLDNRIWMDRSFSFRQEFSDQLYDLRNPDQTSDPMTVKFSIGPEDFPPNVEDLTIQNVLLYFGGQHNSDTQIGNSEVPERLPIRLDFREPGSNTPIGGEAPPMDGVLSTRREQGSAWLSKLQGKRPFGEWTLSFPDTPEMRRVFTQEEVNDILFVVTYKGRNPEWPE